MLPTKNLNMKLKKKILRGKFKCVRSYYSKGQDIAEIN